MVGIIPTKLTRYECLRCSVYGEGDLCWNCGSADKMVYTFAAMWPDGKGAGMETVEWQLERLLV